MEITIILITITVILDSLETISRATQYKFGNKLSIITVFGKRLNSFQTFFLDKYFIISVYLKLFFSILILIFPNSYFFMSVLLLQLNSFIRHKSANSASDQLLIIVLYGVTIYSFNISPLLNEASIYFITILSFTAYLTAGYHKLVSPVWHKGKAVNLVMATDTYGHVPFYHFLKKYNWISISLCWGTIAIDFFMPLFALVFPEAAIIFMIGGFLFHIANAYFMGLNSFLFVFVSTYPCIYHVSVMNNSFIFN